MTIRNALEAKLAAITPAIATAWDNVNYVPVTGTPYQRVHLLRNRPVDHAITLDLLEDRGFLTVGLFYPLGTGAAAAEARAELIRQAFAPRQLLTSGSVRVEIHKTAEIGSGRVDGDRWHVPVSIPWRSFKTS